MTGRTPKNIAARDALVIAAIYDGAVTTKMLADKFITDERSMRVTLRRMLKHKFIGLGGWAERAVRWAPVDRGGGNQPGASA